jgi:hypothetical protein
MSEMKPRDPIEEAKRSAAAAKLGIERQQVKTMLTDTVVLFRNRAKSLSPENSGTKRRLEELANEIESKSGSSTFDGL